MYEEKPVTLLVMPPINNSSNVEAKDLLYTSISKPLAEAGYYVISPLLAMDILKAESAYDSEMFVNGSLSTFHNYFGCDAVVFSEIKTWAKQGFTINTEIRYFIKSAYTGDIIFDRSCDLTLDLHTNSGGGFHPRLSRRLGSICNQYCPHRSHRSCKSCQLLYFQRHPKRQIQLRILKRPRCHRRRKRRAEEKHALEQLPYREPR